jgi:putative ABC transport system permease protein
MRVLRVWLVRAFGLFRSERRGRAFDDELDAHVQAHVEDGLRAGMSLDDARRQAHLSLYGVERTKDAYRDRKGFPMIESLIRDARYGFRTLVKAPAFSLAAILILALGIGANTAIFSVVNAVILRPLPFADSSRIMRLWHTPPATFPSATNGRRIFTLSPANYLDWEAQNHVFDRMALYRFRPFTLTGRGEPETLRGAVVTGGFFGTLGVRAIVGRTLDQADEAPDAPRVVMLLESLWRSRFGSDAGMIGRSISLNGDSYTVVGIVAQRAAHPENVVVWVPLVWTPQERAVRSNHTYLAIAHLKPGVDMKAAQAEMTTISKRLEVQYPADDKGWGASVLPLHEDLVGDVRQALLVLLGAVGFVVLIGSANLANLLLARTLGRSKEMAVRTALGASRRRIIQQVLTETVLLAFGGAAVGLLAGWLSLRFLVTSIGQRLPRAMEIDLDANVLVFTCVVAIAAALLAGMVPAWRLTRGNPNDALKQGAGRTSAAPSERRVRDGLVVCEVALALILLTGAGLLLRTLTELRATDAGIDPANTLTMDVVLPQFREQRAERLNAFVDDVLSRIRSVPGVESVAASDGPPFQAGGASNLPFAIQGRASRPLSEQPIVIAKMIGPGYLRTTRMRLVAGRDFSEDDRPGRELTVLISETMARQFWPTESPVGQRISFGLISSEPRRIVGVVNDVKLLGLSATEPVAAAYLPLVQILTSAPFQFVSLAVRTTTLPESVAPAVVKAIHTLNPDLPVRNVLTMDDIVDRSIGQQRFAMVLISTFAALATLLAAIGIYSVLSFSVGRRVREIGIRRALGASAVTVVGTVVREGLKPAVAGIALGLVAAFALGRVMTTLLFGVGPHDAVTFTTASLGVVLIALAATLIPAYRATRINPMQALRSE